MALTLARTSAATVVVLFAVHVDFGELLVGEGEQPPIVSCPAERKRFRPAYKGDRQWMSERYKRAGRSVGNLVRLYTRHDYGRET